MRSGSRIVLLLLLIAASLTATPKKTEAKGERPNVVLIMTDDQGYGDLGVTGNPVIDTPNIDAMTERGARLTHFYVQPVCSPTRACLMTGRYNYRTRVIDTYLGRSMMEPKEVTVAEALSKAGYATGIFGKWHLGDNYPMRPHDQGFELALVHKGGGLAQPSEPPENNRRYTNPILFRNGKQVQTEGYCTDVYFREGIEWIRQVREEGRPFFLYLPTNAPHGPFHDVPEDLYKKYKDRDLTLVLEGHVPPKQVKSQADRVARIFAMIENVDHNVGRLFAALKEMNVYENTLVLFLVDNGPNTRRYVGPFRGRKGEVYEGGIRSPFLAHWPARLKAGHTSDRTAAHIDLMPTILDACDVSPPEGLALDGRSLLPLLTGRESDWPRRHIVIQSHRGDRPVRYHHMAIRGPRYKLLNNSGFGREELPEGGPEFELYDIRNDPGETNDLAAKHPAIVEKLKRAYDDWFDDVSSTRKNNYAPPRIHIGTPHEHPVVLTRQDWRNVEGGWRRNAVGYWLLHVAADRDYDIRLRFDPKEAPGRAELQIGGRTLTEKMPAGASAVTFKNVRLELGEVKLFPLLHHGDQSRGVYQVDVTWR